MKRVMLAAFVALLIVGASAPAKGDITAWLGSLESDDLLIDGTQVWGGAIGFSFLKYVGVELVVDYVQNSELPFNLEELEDLFGIDVNVDMLFLSGNVIAQYPLEPVTPYATFGYGGFGIRISTDVFDDVEDALSGSTLWTWGFGAKVDVAPWIAVRGEWRNYRLNFTDEEGELDGILGELEDPSFSRLAVGVALTF